MSLKLGMYVNIDSGCEDGCTRWVLFAYITLCGHSLYWCISTSITSCEPSIAVGGWDPSFCLAARQAPSAAWGWLVLCAQVGTKATQVFGVGRCTCTRHVVTDSPWDSIPPDWGLASLHSSKLILRKQWWKCVISTCKVALSYSLSCVFHFAINVIAGLPISRGNWWSPGWLFCIMTSSSMTSGIGNTQPQIDPLPRNCTEAQAHFRCMKKASEINVLSHLDRIQSQEAGKIVGVTKQYIVNKSYL